ncbi:hypothetical protein LF41_3079 [Lysobacter dokdonensis DS-58]|uniref:Uncharacterized protein n=1 Tax=Lysobacter dokdonensis DS-58 TaxID=1300345 RepID=A0A0A2WGW0_9GAMM|nr:hypothetical protein [Lysobacter dokdonensis]KGQ19426.1 hypothetical protein LF41_3079 [Lysobacter dokdonensis DS-58]
MRTSHVLFSIVLALACGGAIAQSAAQAPADTAAKRPGDTAKSWQIAFDRTAKSDGQIRFLVWQNDQDAPTEIAIPVELGQTENSLALETRQQFREILGVKDFETNNKKNVVFVRAKHGERRFTVQVAANTAENVQIDLYAR